MTKISLGGNLPAATANNGLKDIADYILDHPNEEYLAVVSFGVNYVKDHPRGDKDPVLQILHVEPLAGVNALLRDKADDLLGKAFTKRTGEKHRPDPTEDQLDIPADDDTVSEV